MSPAISPTVGPSGAICSGYTGSTGPMAYREQHPKLRIRPTGRCQQRHGRGAEARTLSLHALSLRYAGGFDAVCRSPLLSPGWRDGTGGRTVAETSMGG